MEILAYWVIALVVGIIFLPEYDGGEFRNVPLFIIIVTIALILTLIKVLRYVCFVLKIKKLLVKNGYDVTQCHFMPNFKNSKCYHLSKKRPLCHIDVFFQSMHNILLLKPHLTVTLYIISIITQSNYTTHQKQSQGLVGMLKKNLKY